MQLSPNAAAAPAPIPPSALVPILRAAAGVDASRSSQLPSPSPPPPTAAGASTPPVTTGNATLGARPRPFGSPAAPASRPGQVGIQVANPAIDPIVDRQQRYRIVGEGPLSQRRVVPATIAAAIATAKDDRPVDSVRRVLRLVEQVAGGPERSIGVQVNGVSFADSPEGLAATTYRAHLDDDTKLRRSWAGLDGKRLEREAEGFGRRTTTLTQGLHANVVAGWLNLGPASSAAMLGRGTVNGRALADATRVLAHEAVHLVDPAPSGLSTKADDAWVEARAEARSTRIPQLQVARSALGLEGAVGDAALAASLAIRPYTNAEQLLSHAYEAAGIVAGSEDEQRFLQLSNAAAVDQVVERAGARTGRPGREIRSILDGAFATGIARPG